MERLPFWPWVSVKQGSRFCSKLVLDKRLHAKQYVGILVFCS